MTRREAAEAAGVTERTINRWSAAGDIQVFRKGWREPAEYLLREVMARANRGRELAALADTDSSG